MRGHVRQRGARWTYVVNLPKGPDGKCRQHWQGGFATKREAEQALVAALHELDQRSFVVRSSTTLGDYLSEWLEGLQLAPASIYSYRKSLRRHVIPTIGHIRLQDLDPPVLRHFYALLQTDGNATARPLSGTSVQLIHQILHRALGDAAREGLLSRNVASLVKPPRRSTQERQTWTAEQVRTFLTAAADEYDSAMWLLLVTTGMRRGEVCGLQWRDVETEQQRVLIRRSLSVVEGRTIIGAPKTARSRRALSIDPVTATALHRQRARALTNALAAGAPQDLPAQPVFTAPSGGLLQPSAVGQRFQRLRAGAELPYLRLHDLRHTYATLALEAGMHPKVLSERLGHAGITITLDLYAHVLPSIERAASLAVSQLLLPNAEPAQNQSP